MTAENPNTIFSAYTMDYQYIFNYILPLCTANSNN